MNELVLNTSREFFDTVLVVAIIVILLALFFLGQFAVPRFGLLRI